LAVSSPMAALCLSCYAGNVCRQGRGSGS
jgi:hypothetical protein